MLRQFGLSTVVDLGVALLGVLLVLPAALIWAEQHGPLPAQRLRPAAAAAARSAWRALRGRVGSPRRGCRAARRS